MNKTEFSDFTNLMKKYYADFSFFNPEVASLWFSDLSPYDYNLVALCLKKYVSKDKTRRPPTLGMMNDLIKENYISPKNEEKEYKKDWIDEKYSQDIALGVCNYNRYIYQWAYRLFQRNIEMTFDDALKTVCLERTGHIREFPSQRELEDAGFPKGTKLSPKEAKELLESYYKKGCVL